MLILTHIIIAILGIVMSTVVWFSPTKLNFRLAIGLVTATLLSGSALVVTTHAQLVSACFSGLIYLGITSAAISAAYLHMPKRQ